MRELLVLIATKNKLDAYYHTENIRLPGEAVF